MNPGSSDCFMFTNNTSQDVEKCAFSCIAGKSSIMYLSLKMHISFDPAILLLEIFPKEVSHVTLTSRDVHYIICS